MDPGPRQEDQDSGDNRLRLRAEFADDFDMQPGSMLGYPNDPSVPDVYAEGVSIQIGYTSVGLIFNHITRQPPEVTPVAVVRMSLEQALVTTQVLRRALRDYQKNVGPLRIPQALMDQLDIDEEL